MNAELSLGGGYRSIFLDEDWAHQKYFGWRVVLDRPGLRLLRKQRAIFTRNLALVSSGGEQYLDALASLCGRGSCFSDLIVHDFDSVLRDQTAIGKCRLYAAGDDERLLNVATFVVDLRQEESAIMAAMSADYRRKIRKAERAGLRAEAYEVPSPRLLSEFVRAYTAFAKGRGIATPSASALARMYAHGNALLLAIRSGSTGAVTNFLHLYLAGRTAIFMYGVNLDKQNDGAGQFLHWAAIRELKARGYAWYDLGGASGADRGNGIFTFKERFGGAFVPLGGEWRTQGWGVRAATTIAGAFGGLKKALARNRDRTRALHHSEHSSSQSMASVSLNSEGVDVLVRQDQGNAASPRRIALVLPRLLPLAGAERVAVAQARDFRERGYEVDLVVLSEPLDPGDAVPAGVRYFELGASRIRDAILPLARYLRTERPDAVHAFMWPLTSVTVLARLLARSDALLVVSDHGMLSFQYARWGRLNWWWLRASTAMTYPFAHARVAVSSSVADDLALLSGIGRDCFTVIHNPVPVGTDENHDASKAEAAWAGWSGKRILTVGRLKAVKNHALLIQAFRKLLERTDARLMILGVGELADSTAETARAAGIGDKVLMPGYALKPLPYYRSADLFVLSSDYEGFGNVLVEALGCGLPVVSTDCPGGPAEILQNGKFGRLVPVRDETALADAMFEALNAVHDRDALKKRAADFSPQVATERYLNLMFPPASPGWLGRSTPGMTVND